MRYPDPALTAPPFQAPKPLLQESAPSLSGPQPPLPRSWLLRPLSRRSVPLFPSPRVHPSPPQSWPLALALLIPRRVFLGSCFPLGSALDPRSWGFAELPSPDYLRPSLGLCAAPNTLRVPAASASPTLSLLSRVTFSLGARLRGFVSSPPQVTASLRAPPGLGKALRSGSGGSAARVAAPDPDSCGRLAPLAEERGYDPHLRPFQPQRCFSIPTPRTPTFSTLSAQLLSPEIPSQLPLTHQYDPVHPLPWGTLLVDRKSVV